MGLLEMRFLGKRNISKRRLYGVVALAVLALAVAGAGIGLGSSGSSAPFQPPLSQSGALATAPDSASLAAFGIMRRSRTSADDLSSHAAGGLSSASGANLALSRKAEGFTNGEAWVIPGIGNECLWAESTTAQNGGAVCDGDATATTGHLMLEATSPSAPGKVFIAGLVPDGIPSVAVNLEDGSTVTLPVHENVYMQEITGELKSITVTPSLVLHAAMPSN
jgi:hypothetical protein